MIHPTRLYPICFLPTIVLALAAGPAMAQTVTFDDLTLPPDSYNSGPFSNAVPIAVENDGFSSGELSTFSSGQPAPVQFVNNYDTTFDSWSGFAYSNVNDTIDGTYTNQYAAYPGVGAEDPVSVAHGRQLRGRLRLSGPESESLHRAELRV